MSTDAIVMLKDDHKVILRTFRDFENAGDDAHQTKGDLVARIIELLTVHTYLENEVMYPRVRELVPELEDDVLESYEEHHVADVLVMELVGMKPTDERFTAKTTVLIENVRHHIEEEEDEWFPQVREALGRKVLQEIGAEMAEARKKAPAQPGSAERVEEDHRRRHLLTRRPATQTAGSSPTSSEGHPCGSSSPEPPGTSAPHWLAASPAAVTTSWSASRDGSPTARSAARARSSPG